MASREEGYEPLLDEPGLGDERGRPQGAPTAAASQRGPTFTQPAAQGAQAAGPASAAAAPALGVPVYPQQQGQPHGGQQRQRDAFHSFPPYLEALPPSAEQEWDKAAVLMSVWLGCSAATLTLSLLTFNVLAIIASGCATLGAATHRCKWARPATAAGDLGALMAKVFGLSVVSASFSSLVSLLFFLIAMGLSATCSSAEDPTACAQLTEVTVFYAVWFSIFTGITLAVVRRTNHMRRLLNPVSSGVVSI